MNSTRRQRRPTGRPAGKRPLLLLGIATIFMGGMYLGYVLTQPPPRPDFTAQPAEVDTSPDGAGTASQGSDSGAGSTTESSPAVEPPTDLPTLDPEGESSRPVAPNASSGAPRVAIVVDDLGRSLRDIEQLDALGVALTYAVLPFESKTEAVVRELQRRGKEYLCHLPMQAENQAVDPGPGALFLSMTLSELEVAALRALDAVPGAAGANNHMGSAIVANSEAMNTVLELLKQRNLYFLDSRTTKNSVGFSLALKLAIPTTERQVFLDNDRDPEAIRKQFEELLAMARKRGSALAIAHPYPETLATLASQIPYAQSLGIEFVTASALLQ